MNRAVAVIGSAFGDEGKGLMVDYFASQMPGAMVVRHSGGAQAGHTVCTPDGRRHVFSHFGAGSLVGCQTLLSRYFILNPLIWVKEVAELDMLCSVPALYVDEMAPLTTPYDIFINRTVESRRGHACHGSVGIGINETITRCERGDLTTLAWHLMHPDVLLHKLQAIRGHARDRLIELGVEIDSSINVMLAEDAVVESYMNICDRFRRNVAICDGRIMRDRDIIFEGAQGLLLDQDHEFFPHVTRAKTGIHNAALLAADAGISDIDVTYVTRAYATRHGAGPFPTEDIAVNYFDDTNTMKDFQGELRFGHLDLDLMEKSVIKDLATASRGVNLHHNIAVTHLDQVEHVKMKYHGMLTAWDQQDLKRQIFWCFGVDGYVSYGPTRNDVKPCNQMRMAAAG